MAPRNSNINCTWYTFRTWSTGRKHGLIWRTHTTHISPWWNWKKIQVLPLVQLYFFCCCCVFNKSTAATPTGNSRSCGCGPGAAALLLYPLNTTCTRYVRRIGETFIISGIRSSMLMIQKCEGTLDIISQSLVRVCAVSAAQQQPRTRAVITAQRRYLWAGEVRT